MEPERTDTARLMTTVERALSRYVAGCAAHDKDVNAGIFTDFAVIEYSAGAPGRFVGSDAISSDRCWAGDALAGRPPADLPIWIYPTSDANTVLIQYTVVVDRGAARHSVQDIAVLEMSGDRIARIRDYMLPADMTIQSILASK